MQIPAGKIYGLLLGMALRMRKGVEHVATTQVPGRGECAFSASGGKRVRMHSCIGTLGHRHQYTVIPSNAGIHADYPK
jgi:hypothetical protein